MIFPCSERPSRPLSAWLRPAILFSLACLATGCARKATTGACGGDAAPGVASGVVTVPLAGCHAVGFTAPVGIGSQQFTLLVDTGSTTTVVASSSCTDCSSVSPLYTPGPDATDLGTMDTSDFGTGSVVGDVYSDSVQMSAVPRSLPLDFLAVDSASMFPLFEDEDCAGNATSTTWSDGIVGFGPADLALDGTQSYFGQLRSIGAVKDLFALQLCGSGGTLWLGGYDASCVTSAPEYTPLAASPYYAVSVSDMGLGASSLGASDYGAAVLDSGSNTFILPADAYQALTSQVTASAGFRQAFAGQSAAYFDDLLTSTNPCVASTGGRSPSQVDALLPAMTLTLPDQAGGDFTLKLPPTQSYIRVVTVGGATEFCPNVVSASALGPAGLVPTDLPSLVMQSYVAIFDLANSRIGFAPQQGC